MRLAGILPVAVCAAALAAAQDSRAVRQAAMETITAADLKAHLTVLASDEMRGRVTPSKELGVAAKYLAAQFEKAGAKPAAPGGGFFQTRPTPVIGFDLAAARISFVVNGEKRAVEPWKDADVAVRGSASVALDDAKIVPVDAKDLSEEGSGALRDEAERLKGALLLVSAKGWTGKRDPLESLLARAESVGAAGCIVVGEGWHPPAGLRDFRRARLEARRVARQSSEARPPCLGIAIEDEALAAALVKAGGATVSAKVPAVKSEDGVSNVIAMVEAAPGPHAAEAVVFTAHYDHIGMTMPVDGDWILNGADDDGSGTVALLELAQAYASMKPAPARKVLFCAFFGEEKGGLGSRFYVENPAHPLAKTVCDVNIEMIGRSFGVGKKVAWVTGYDYSDLGTILAEGGAAAGVKIVPDPYPRQNFFLRSDNVAFVKHKVPGHSISAGSTHADYHGLNDEVDRIEFDNMEAIVRAVFLGSAAIADGSRTARWTREIPRVP